MHSFKLILFREEGGLLYKEAECALLHMVPPQFHRDEKSRLTDYEAKELFTLAARGAQGEHFRTDLLRLEATPPVLPSEPLPTEPQASLLDHHNL